MACICRRATGTPIGLRQQRRGVARSLAAPRRGARGLGHRLVRAGRSCRRSLSPESTARPNPLILRALGVSSVEEIVAANGPLAESRDRGDREIIREALLSGVPAILTTDLRSVLGQA